MNIRRCGADIWRYRRLWAGELLWLGLLMALTAVLFSVTALDVRLQARFYAAEGPARWPLEDAPLWRWLRDVAAPLPGFVAACAAFIGLALSYARRRLVPYRLHSLFVLLALVLGPGLVVNGLLKERFARPRPRQLEQFGGHLAYRAALQPGPHEGGMSFPCGHSSIAFYLSAFYFLFRRRRKRLAALALAGATAFGLLVGVGRMVAGAHFLSDVLWSGYLVFLVSLALYYFVLNIPASEDGLAVPGLLAGRSRWALGVSAVVLVGILLALLVSTPFHSKLRAAALRLSALEEPPEIVLTCARGDVVLSVGAGDEFRVEGLARGFAFPGSEVKPALTRSSDAPRVTYELRRAGWFGELEADLEARVPAAGVRSLTVALGKGTLTAGPAMATPPRLILRVESGRIILPDAWRRADVDLRAPPGAVLYR